MIGGAAVVLGYLAIAEVQLNLFQLMNGLTQRDWAAVLREGPRLALVVSLVFVPFLAAGLALAAIFATHAERIGGLYGADLLGAGLGCALSVPLLVVLSPPGSVLLVGLLFALAGLRLAAGSDLS